MVAQRAGDLQWLTNCVSNLQNSNTIRCLQKGLGGVLPESVNRGSVDSPGVKPPCQCSGIVSHQTSPSDFFEKVQSQISSFSSRRYDCPFIPDENRGNTKQGDDIHFQRDLGIYNVQRDHAYCRVPARQIERQSRLGFQKFPRLERMATIFKSIARNLCKVRIPRVGSFSIESMPSDTILPVVESRSTQPSNRCIPAESETSGATVCFSPFFNDKERKILLKFKAEEMDVILITPSWPAQSWYSQVLELSVTKPLLLPQLSNTLVHPQDQVHPLVVNQTLRLVAWKVSGRAWSRKEFQQGLQRLSQMPEDQAHHLNHVEIFIRFFSLIV